MQRLNRGIAEAKRKQEAKYQQQQEQFNKQMVELRRQINHKDATNEEQLKTNARVSCNIEERRGVSSYACETMQACE